MRSIDWKTLAPLPPPGTPTFAHQHTLPQLPLPELNDTLKKLKESVKPLAWSEEEYQSCLAKIDAFGKPGGLAETAHARLVERKRAKVHWLEEWWDDLAYLNYRDSIVVNVSYYYGFDAHPAHLPSSQLDRAAALTRSAMLFRQKYRAGLIPPDTVKEGALCMDTWRWMFDCCRFPDFPDASVSYATKEPGEIDTVVFLHRGHPWAVSVSDSRGEVLPTDVIKAQLEQIVTNTPHTPQPGVGILTSADRGHWAKSYQYLIQDPVNEATVNAIHKSAFVVCLDQASHAPAPDCSAESIIPFSRALWNGGIDAEEMHNRWCDKPLQFIVFKEGKDGQAGAGIMGEHSIMDGTPVTRMCDEVLNALADPKFDHGSSSGVSVPQPTRLEWNIDSTTSLNISTATSYIKDLVGSQAMTYTLTKYGKRAIKGFRISPDSWTQLIIQLAFYRLCCIQTNGAPDEWKKKRHGGTYEAATTRRFLKGRTECVRVASNETDAFVEGMDDSTLSDEERINRLRKAADKHIKLAKEAGLAQGIDRHLLGLKMSLTDSEKESLEIFKDPLYQRSSKWVLSTSAIWSPHFPSYGWGEVVPDGWGVAYMTGYDDKLQFTITSRKEMPHDEFAKQIAKAAEDMRLLFEKSKL